jgi:hypothetical protein
VRGPSSFIGRSVASDVEAYDRAQEAVHEHDYEPDTRPGLDGIVCKVCGFRVSGELVGMVRS